MPLLIVVPFAPSDLPIHEPYLALMEHFAGLEKNNILVVARKDVEAEAVAAADRLRRLAKSCALHVIPERKPSWPDGPNDMFQRTVQYLKEDQNQEPWLWMEQDAPPIAAGWAGAMMGVHNEGGMPFTGRTFEAIECCDKPNAPGAKEHFDGKLMNGVGIYPADFHLRSQLYRMVNREKPPVPWDLYCRWEIAPNCNHTDLIVGVRRATNFKRIDGGFTCTSRGEEKVVMTKDAVLLHSCKDSSLAEIITGKTFAEIPVRGTQFTHRVEDEDSKAVSGVPSGGGLVPSVQSGVHEELEAGQGDSVRVPNESLGPVVSEVGAQKGANPETPVQDLPESGQPDASPGPAEAPGSGVVLPSAPSGDSEDRVIPILTKVGEIVVGKRSVKLNDLAKKCGAKPASLEATLGSSEQFVVYGGRCKYVRRKAA